MAVLLTIAAPVMTTSKGKLTLNPWQLSAIDAREF
jgi:hypothetical protein